jgi:hypothetical protein
MAFLSGVCLCYCSHRNGQCIAMPFVEPKTEGRRSDIPGHLWDTKGIPVLDFTKTL